MNIFCKYIKPIKIIMTWMWCVATSFKNFFFHFLCFVTYCEEATTCVLLPFFPLFNSDLIFPTLFSAAELPVVLATVEQKLIELTTLTNLEGKCDFSYVTISAILNLIFASKFFRFYSLKKSGFQRKIQIEK